MSKKVVTAPKPEVVHLPTLLRRVQSGEIRVPAFQRPFVWDEKQVLELLGSVYKGYPIGSLLFWRTDVRTFRHEAAKSFPFPNVEAQENVSFLLDGQQRLATLYGCLGARDGEAGSSTIFDVHFDLAERRFLHSKEEPPPPTAIALSAIFSTREFLAAQQALLRLPNGDTLLEEAVRLHAGFQEYLVPTVTIEGRAIQEVVEIFERINRTGTKLSVVDFMRAVTWTSKFDLATSVQRLQAELGDLGFAIPPETIVKTIAMGLDKAPVLDEMLKLRGTDPTTLSEATAKTRRALLAAVQFAREKCKIFSYHFVPYEGQFLVVAKLFLLSRNPSAEVLDSVQRWLLGVSFSEWLQGKSDEFVARTVDSIRQVAEGKTDVLKWQFAIPTAELSQRPFRRGSALSSGVAELLAISGARSLITGNVVPPEAFTGEGAENHFESILDREQLSKALEEDVSSAKVLANVVVLDDGDRRDYRKAGERALDRVEAAMARHGSRAQAVFDSQFIPEQAIAALRRNDSAGFLRARALEITRRAQESLGIPAEEAKKGTSNKARRKRP